MKRTALAAALVAALFLAAPAQAFNGPVASQAAHFAACLKLMFSDPVAHAAQCGPGHDVFLSGHSGTNCASVCPSPPAQATKPE